MKLHVHLKMSDFAVDEVVEGADSEALVVAIQQRVAQEAPFLVAAFVRRMTPLAFAQEAARRYNATTKQNLPLPANCDEFVQMGVDRKFATRVES